jgi:apolipoprotein N-acyltransferase
MSYRKISILFLLIILTALLAACGSSAAAAGPEKAVETYLTALVNQDANRLTTASCKAWEEKAKLEADSFQAVKAKLDGMVCVKAGDEGTSAKVTCKGKIVATYGNENQEIPLDRRTYLASQEGGEWRMCGYTK